LEASITIRCQNAINKLKCNIDTHDSCITCLKKTTECSRSDKLNYCKTYTPTPPPPPTPPPTPPGPPPPSPTPPPTPPPPPPPPPTPPPTPPPPTPPPSPTPCIHECNPAPWSDKITHKFQLCPGEFPCPQSGCCDKHYKLDKHRISRRHHGNYEYFNLI
jgi:hypothetical protein